MFAFTLFRRHGNPPRDTAVHGVIFFRLDHIVENITRLIKQDRDFLTGKLQLTEEFLKTETFRNKTDIKSLSEKINDAMVGH
ncbi:hypothetical protein ACSLO7_30785, partial [Klebsiella pneumoniae]